MVIVLTNTLDATANYLVPILDTAEIDVVRFDTDDLVPRLKGSYRSGNASLRWNNRKISPGDIEHIWYRRPDRLTSQLFGDTPEGNYARLEWTEFVECFLAHIPQSKWMNHPARNVAASRKLQQLTLASKIGFAIPDTLITQDPQELRDFFDQHEGQLIVKPMSTGYVERPDESCDTLVYTNRVQKNQLDDLADLVNCPTLFQQFIQKKSDVRITVVDDEIHAVELLASDEFGNQRCDIRRNNMVDVSYQAISLPPTVHQSIRDLMRHYQLRFGAIDMAITPNGEWVFFEINPNGQWAWLDLTAGTSIAESFISAFTSKQPSTISA
jgi:glutathione synthase/RimK-type ligase-like ATP-grasp enzyme